MRDAELKERIRRSSRSNYRVYGARKMWRELNRQGHEVARCTVERLMRELGIAGAVRGKRVITTLPDGQAERPRTWSTATSSPPRPNRCWVADFTYVKTWAGVVYVAFVVDTFSRRIVGWRAATSMETVWCWTPWRWRSGTATAPASRPDRALIHHSDAGSQYTSFRLHRTARRGRHRASIGSVGDAYDNALVESRSACSRPS